MRMYDIIEKKRDKKNLSKNEIDFFINGYVSGKITDAQASALLMAIYLNGMEKEELYYLTKAMAKSASILDLSMLKEDGSIVVDKHSTGGVGDKVTLLVLPIVAALGVKVMKMSGRGLGFTGGTADKIESVKGYNLYKPLDEAITQVETIGACLISQSSEIAIADKKLYSLRDVTATVSSTELIASSIMSKKLASGADKIILDVTVGGGAFMQDLSSAKNLAKIMVDIGKAAGKETIALITSMDQPLGKNVGNVVEIKEVISFLLSDESTLNLYENKDLKEVVFEVAAQMVKIAGLNDDIEQIKLDIMKVITSRKAYDKFIKIIKAQGGHIHQVYMDWLNLSLDMPLLLDEVKYMKEIYADKDGSITNIDSRKIGKALIALGGSRNNIDDEIDHSVGFEFSKKVGSSVKKGDVILTVLYNDKQKFKCAFEYIKDAIHITKIEQSMSNLLKSKPVILDVIS